MDLKPINKFMARVKQLSDAKQKDIRISVSEAIELTTCIAELLALQASTKPTSTFPTVIHADGGTLKK